MPSKEQLHQLVDRLPGCDTAIQVVAALAASDPLTRALESAPLNDEPYTEEHQRRDDEVIRRTESGQEQLIPHEQIKRELGLP